MAADNLERPRGTPIHRTR